MPSGSGADVYLASGACGTLIVKASDDAVAADLTWARQVAEADGLARALGAPSIEADLTVNNFPGQVGITTGEAVRLSGSAPGPVLALFFESRVKESSTLSLDTLGVIVDAPETWEDLLDHLRTELEPPVLIATGSVHSIALPEGVMARRDTLQAVSPAPGLKGSVSQREDGSFELAIQTTESVPFGVHRVYLYGGESRFEPIDALNVNVVKPEKLE